MNKHVAARDGFALVAVLWLLVGASALGLTVSLAAREAVASARNRMDAERAHWLAEDCLERMRAAIAESLRDEDRIIDPAAEPAWVRLDETVRAYPWLRASGCAATLEPAGARLDVNTASESALGRLFRAAGLAAAVADSLAAAIADWRDADRVPRPLGAERRDYIVRGRPPPRDAPFADLRELRRVRGWDDALALDTLLSVETDPVCLRHAPIAVLEALPGFTSELVSWLVVECGGPLLGRTPYLKTQAGKVVLENISRYTKVSKGSLALFVLTGQC